MTRPPLKNVGASVRARLTDYARQRGDNAQLLMPFLSLDAAITMSSQQWPQGGPWTTPTSPAKDA